MKLVEIKKGNGEVEPIIKFRLSGTVSMTRAFINNIDENILNNTDVYYLHVYTEESRIGVSIDQNDKNGMKIRFEKTKRHDKNTAHSIVGTCRGLILKLTKILDWPLAPDKNKSIAYELTNEIIEIDGNKIFILK